MKQFEAVKEARVSFEQVQPSLEKLKNSPNDPPANLAVGLHYCLKVGQWARGLPLLARGSDSGFKDLATTELAKPTDGKIALKLATNWWDRSEAKGTGEPDATAMKIHAGEWYRLGQNEASGLEARAVQTRLAKICPVGSRRGPERGRLPEAVNMRAALDLLRRSISCG